MASTALKYLLRSAAALLSALLVAPALSSCDDSAIFDYEGDCDIHYKLRFSFDYNLLYADAFPAHVHSVGVYAFRPDGTFAWQRCESGWQLSEDGYTMNLDGVDPGEFRLVAWCGMDNAFIGGRPESFTLPILTPGVSTEDDLRCALERERRADGSAHSSKELWDLFHGTVNDVEIISPDDYDGTDGKTVTYTCNLKKNTNKVRVILQQLSLEDVEAEGFSYKIEAANGLMAHDNELLDDEVITYHPWNQGSGVAGIAGTDYTRADDYTPVKVAIADLSVARLVKGEKMDLTVTNGDGETIAKVPIIDYALLTKGNYSRPMTDQEFLDREDTYTLTFFLDRNYRWDGVSILINSWRVVPDNVEIN